MNRWPRMWSLVCMVLFVASVVSFPCAAAQVHGKGTDYWVFNVYLEEDGTTVHLEYSRIGNEPENVNRTESLADLSEKDLLDGVKMFSNTTEGIVVLHLFDKAHLYVVNSTIKGFRNNIEGFNTTFAAPILIDSNSYLHLERSEVIENEVGFSGGLWCIGGSKANLTNVQLSHNIGKQVGGLFAEGADTIVHLLNVNLTENKGPDVAHDVAVTKGATVTTEAAMFHGLNRASYHNSLSKRLDHWHDLRSKNRLSNISKRFSDSMPGSIYVGSGGSLVLYKSEVSWYVSLNGAVHCAKNSMVLIQESRIMDNFGLQGSGVVASGANVSLIECEFFRNLAKIGGAVASLQGTLLHISGTHFVDNHATLGGAVYISHSLEAICSKGIPNAKVVIHDVKFIDNVALLDGGAILNMCEGISVSNTSFQKCTAGASGGGIHLYSAGTVVLEDLLFEECSATMGGALRGVKVKDLQLTSTNFFNNEAKQIGGAMHAPSCACVSALHIKSFHNTANGAGGSFAFKDVQLVNLTDVELESNQANESGGGIYAEKVQTLRIQNTTVSSNRAKHGGGLFVLGSNTRQGLKTSRATAVLSVDQKRRAVEGTSGVVLDDVSFLDNEAGGEGGGAWMQNAPQFHSARCTFQSNSAGSGGGALYLANANSAKISGATGNQNTCKGAGGFAMISQILDVLLMDSSLSENSATHSGGALALVGSLFKAINVTMAANSADDGAGALFVYKSTSVQLTESIFNENQAGTYGGALFALKVASMTLKQCYFHKNHAKSSFGGAIALSNSTDVNFEAENCTFTANQAGLIGGAIALDSRVASIKIKDSNFADNTAEKSGGSVSAAYAETSTIQNTKFTGSLAHTEGGALSILEGTSLNISSVTFDQCGCLNGDGGAVSVKSMTDVKVSNSIFTACTSQGAQGARGGALSIVPSKIIPNSSLLLSNCRLKENVAESGGGGVYVEKVATVTTRNCQFYRNSVVPGNGGAMAISSASNLTVVDCALQGNAVESSGGALYIIHVEKAIISSSFRTNVAGQKHGGAIFADYLMDLELSKARFETNRAQLSGGGVFIEQGNTITGHDLVFRSNEAQNLRGGGMSIEAVREVTLFESEFTTNFAESGGGAMWIHELPPQTMDVNVSMVNFFENESEGPGGAILMQGSLEVQATTLNSVSRVDNQIAPVTLRMKRVAFKTNKAHVGGAIHAAEGHVEIEASTFKGNEASRGGGGFSCGDGVNSNMLSVSFTENRAKTGSGVTADCGCEVELDDCDFTDNASKQYKSGAVSSCNGNVVDNNSTFSGNSGGRQPWWYYLIYAAVVPVCLLFICCSLCFCRIAYKKVKKKLKKDRVYTDYAAIGAADPNAPNLQEIVQERLRAERDGSSMDSSLKEIPAKPLPRPHSGMDIHYLPTSASNSEAVESMEEPIEAHPLPEPEASSVGPSQSLMKPLIEEEE